ncbi:MAG: M3 family oligoendopeptidase [Oscillospiraceae bacterium]
MLFSQMKYSRPPVDEILHEYETLQTKIRTASSADEALTLFWQYEKVNESLTTAKTIAEIRNTINTADEFYEGEKEFFDECTPALSSKSLDVCRALIESPFRDQLEKALSPLLFTKMEQNVKSLSPEILPLMAEENALVTRYDKLYASVQIEFDGKMLTLSALAPYKQSPDRAVRKAAYIAEGNWFDAHQDELDEIYDKLVKNRDAQGRAMGYENYIPLGFIRMHRIGYSIKDLEAYRAQIIKDVVPAVCGIKDLQKKRIGISDFMLWDNAFCFKSGNAAPKGTPDEILAAGRKMYNELAPETAQFIESMMSNELFDVLSKPGKAQGGYCTYLPGYKMPFIFSNFNGTSDDVDVLTHEAGHAFAAYIAAGKSLPAILEEPGMESCEIHSMSMEFLTSDYHELFFGEDTKKYQLYHAEDALTFLPYGTMVDEFQHIMYAKPSLTPKERNEVWKTLEAKYRPWLNMGDVPFYSRGAQWQRQLHIYEIPFYYIDYCLAQSVALQFFSAFLQDKTDAWHRYLALVNKAGTESYTELISSAGFASPFKDGTLSQLTASIYKWISDNQVD